MKPEKIDLDLKKLARESYFNAIRLYKDAVLLFTNGSYPSSFFCAVTCIEEIGKMMMIDHFFADMTLNHEVFGHPKKLFIDTLFSRKNFYSHTEKQSTASEGSFISFLFEKYEDYEEFKKEFSKAEKNRQKSIYVDYFKENVISPDQEIFKEDTERVLKFGFHIIEDIEDSGLSGSYWTETLKTKRKARVILEEIKRQLENEGLDLSKVKL